MNICLIVNFVCIPILNFHIKPFSIQRSPEVHQRRSVDGKPVVRLPTWTHGTSEKEFIVEKKKSFRFSIKILLWSVPVKTGSGSLDANKIYKFNLIILV
jgi:hypothetical protein